MTCWSSCATTTAAPRARIYRALDFLLEQGLIHKVKRLSAFVDCMHAIDDEDAHHHHAAQFLICRRCGLVIEVDEHDIGQALARAARRSGFWLDRCTIEAEGVCAACAAGPRPAEPCASGGQGSPTVAHSNHPSGSSEPWDHSALNPPGGSASGT